jgi:hypothetical protein
LFIDLIASRSTAITYGTRIDIKQFTTPHPALEKNEKKKGSKTKVVNA